MVVDFELCLWLIVLCGKHSQAESAAGAAHLSIDYAGVLKVTQMRTKISVDQKGKSLLDFHIFITSAVRESTISVKMITDLTWCRFIVFELIKTVKFVIPCGFNFFSN